MVLALLFRNNISIGGGGEMVVDKKGGLSDWSRFLVSFPALLGSDDAIDCDRVIKTVGKVIVLWDTVVESCGYGVIIICLLDNVAMQLNYFHSNHISFIANLFLNHCVSLTYKNYEIVIC